MLDKLSSMKFLPVVEQEASDKVEKGSVTRVSPGSGELVLQGSQITVYVSTGKPQVSVPISSATRSPEPRPRWAATSR